MTTFLFTAKEGKPDFGSSHNRSRFNEHLKDNEGKQYKITKVETKRTLSQNNYYWVYLGIIERETGNSTMDLHEFAKREFLPPKFIYIRHGNGVVERKIPSSTTDLTKIQMSDYLDKICAWSNVELPDPKDSNYMTD